MEPFPPTGTALQDPNGLLAVGGDLSAERLLEAYRRGIFPWYEADEPILWWTPNPRAVLKPENFYASKSFRKFLRRTDWWIEVNQQFHSVVDACSALTPEREATWISTPMKQAYQELHRLGYAHSIEVMDQGSLVGGLYGVKLGSIFFGESMFSKATNASKFALHALCRGDVFADLTLIDCQMPSEHLSALGMSLISREEFEQALQAGISLSN